MQSGRMISPDEFWQRQSALDQQVRESFSRRLAYGLEQRSGAAMSGEWSLGGSSSALPAEGAASTNGVSVVA